MGGEPAALAERERIAAFVAAYRPSDAVELIFSADGWHSWPDPASVLAELAAAVRAGRHLAVAEEDGDELG